MTNFDLVEDNDLVATGYDTAIAGILLSVDEDGNPYRRVAYYTEAVLDILMCDGMSDLEALEYFEFNISGAYVGPHTPVFLERRW